jgi:hypothetical protein
MVDEGFILKLLEQNQQFLKELLEQNHRLVEKIMDNVPKFKDDADVFYGIKEQQKKDASFAQTKHGKYGYVVRIAKKVGCPADLIEIIKKEMSEVDLFNDDIYNEYKDEKKLKARAIEFKTGKKQEPEIDEKLSVPEIIKKKKGDFAKEIEPYVLTYGKDMCNDFFRYWAESDNKGKLKWEKTKQKQGGTWEISLRLATWSKKPFNQPKGGKAGAPTPNKVVSDKKLLGMSKEQLNTGIQENNNQVEKKVDEQKQQVDGQQQQQQ